MCVCGVRCAYPLCKAVAICCLPSPCPHMDVPLGCLLLVLVTAAFLPLPSPTLAILAVLEIGKLRQQSS
jgi:hypothetical protein